MRAAATQRRVAAIALVGAVIVLMARSRTGAQEDGSQETAGAAGAMRGIRGSGGAGASEAGAWPTPRLHGTAGNGGAATVGDGQLATPSPSGHRPAPARTAAAATEHPSVDRGTGVPVRVRPPRPTAAGQLTGTSDTAAGRATADQRPTPAVSAQSDAVGRGVDADPHRERPAEKAQPREPVRDGTAGMHAPNDDTGAQIVGTTTARATLRTFPSEMRQTTRTAPPPPPRTTAAATTSAVAFTTRTPRAAGTRGAGGQVAASARAATTTLAAGSTETPRETCATVHGGVHACAAGEDCVDTSAGPVCIASKDGPAGAAASVATSTKKSRVLSELSKTLQRQQDGIARIRAAVAGTSTRRRWVNGTGLGPHDCTNRSPKCVAEWEACCPGGKGGPQCGDPDCNTHRKKGKPCLGIFMQLECPRVCGLCDNHDLVRTPEDVRAIDAVKQETAAEIEKLTAAFGAVLKAATLGDEAPAGWNQTVILVTVSSGFLDFFHNWRITARRAGFARFLVVAEDVVARDEAEMVAPGRVVLCPAAAERAEAAAAAEAKGKRGALAYASSEYKSLVNRRPRYIRALLGLGVNVLYTDIDTVWMGSPFDGFAGVHDVWIQSDMLKPDDYLFHSLCTGLIMLRAGENTVRLVLEWEHALATRGDQQHGNQFIFNTVAWRHIRQSKVSVRPLDPKLFPSGAISYFYPEWLSEQNGQPLVIHNNYMVGRDKKRAVFVSHGLWFADE